MRKIIFSDLDGTIINRSQNELHEGNFEAIKKWREAGNLFVLCTGRNPIDIQPTLKVADLEYDYMVLCNGASLYDHEGKCIFEEQFPLELGKEILKEASKNKDLLTFYCDDKQLVMSQHDDVLVIDENGDKLGNVFNQPFSKYVDDATCFRMLCFIDETGSDLLYEYQDLLLVPHQDEISWFFNTECIDIMSYGVSKGNGMARLAEILGADIKDIYAIGDSFNDVSMVEMAGNGCTFDYAPEVLRKRAKYIVPSIKGLIDGIMEGKF